MKWTSPRRYMKGRPERLVQIHLIPLFKKKKKFMLSCWQTCKTSTTLSCCLVAKLCPTLCNPMDCRTPGFPVLYHLLELAQTHVHWVGDAIQPSRPLSSVYVHPKLPNHPFPTSSPLHTHAYACSLSLWVCLCSVSSLSRFFRSHWWGMPYFSFSCTAVLLAQKS